jgi:hypothetical protein
MGLQDNIFDVEAALEGKPEFDLFTEIIRYLGRLEHEVENKMKLERDELAASAPIHYQQARTVYGAEMPAAENDLAAFMAVWAKLRYMYADAALMARTEPPRTDIDPEELPVVAEMMRHLQKVIDWAGRDPSPPPEVVEAKRFLDRVQFAGRYKFKARHAD